MRSQDPARGFFGGERQLGSASANHLRIFLPSLPTGCLGAIKCLLATGILFLGFWAVAVGGAVLLQLGEAFPPRDGALLACLGRAFSATGALRPFARLSGAASSSIWGWERLYPS